MSWQQRDLEVIGNFWKACHELIEWDLRGEVVSNVWGPVENESRGPFVQKAKKKKKTAIKVIYNFTIYLLSSASFKSKDQNI